jgi:hypothetical protein
MENFRPDDVLEGWMGTRRRSICPVSRSDAMRRLNSHSAAHTAHRDHQDRRIVITSIAHRDRESERSDEQAVQLAA